MTEWHRIRNQDQYQRALKFQKALVDIYNFKQRLMDLLEVVSIGAKKGRLRQEYFDVVGAAGQFLGDYDQIRAESNAMMKQVDRK